MNEARAIARCEEAAALLPPRFRRAALQMPDHRKRYTEEFRLRAGQPPAALLPEGEVTLPYFGADSRVTPRDLAQMVDAVTDYSRYACAETLRQGFGWRYPAAALADIPAKVSVTSLVHAAEQTTLERPGFLSKDGLTAAEMGTALHAFLEHADFGALAAVRDAEDDAVLDAVRAERERQGAAQLTPPAIAGKLDVYKILRFVRSEAFRRICGAEDVLRELAFITSLPAAEVMAAQGRALPDGPAADAGVLVQGIADIVLIYPDHLELLDYKTDRRKTPADFVRAYRAQLELYAKAIEKRFAPRRVTYKGIYSLELGELIQV